MMRLRPLWRPLLRRCWSVGSFEVKPLDFLEDDLGVVKGDLPDMGALLAARRARTGVLTRLLSSAPVLSWALAAARLAEPTPILTVANCSGSVSNV